MSNDNRSAAIWKWSVLLLAVLNIALIVTIWFRPGSEHRRPPQGGGQGSFLIEQLHLSADQIKQFNELRKVHHDSIELLRGESGKLRDDFFANLKSPNIDAKLIDSLAKGIADNQVQVEKATFYHFYKVRALCDDKQKPVFDQIIGDVLRMMAPKGPPKGEGPPPR